MTDYKKIVEDFQKANPDEIILAGFYNKDGELICGTDGSDTAGIISADTYSIVQQIDYHITSSRDELFDNLLQEGNKSVTLIKNLSEPYKNNDKGIKYLILTACTGTKYGILFIQIKKLEKQLFS
jgi:hypothetical protein